MTIQKHYTTNQLADLVYGSPNTIRTRYCKHGSYYGIKPVKLPSGFLLWPAAEVDAMLAGRGV